MVEETLYSFLLWFSLHVFWTILHLLLKMIVFEWNWEYLSIDISSFTTGDVQFLTAIYDLKQLKSRLDIRD